MSHHNSLSTSDIMPFVCFALCNTVADMVFGVLVIDCMMNFRLHGQIMVKFHFCWCTSAVPSVNMLNMHALRTRGCKTHCLVLVLLKACT